MGSSAAEIARDGEPESSETTIEIKLKTLDSQTYTLRVDKQMPVPALKEQIASVTGVLSDQQRLICRGKVLKDDQLLSAYHVEDGHTLHLVVRQPIPPSSDGSHDQSGLDPGLGTGHSRHVGSSVLIETFNVPDQGDGVTPDISRIVSSILGSFGLASIGSSSNGIDARGHGTQRVERTFGATGVVDPPQIPPEQSGLRGQTDRLQSTFGIPTAVSMGPLQPPVIPDSLATLSQYLSHLRREFEDIGGGRGNEPQTSSMGRTEDRDSNTASHSSSVQQGLPTPASLAEVLLSTRQMLIEQAAECQLRLARELEDQVNVTDSSARSRIQSNAMRSGALLHNLGSFLLELGRATMTVRLGQTPSEAVVNAGPAVFISPSSPNPLMVQAFPFQPATGFGAMSMGTLPPGPGLVNGLGTEFVPRRIDIQIRRGSSIATPNREDRSGTQQSPEQTTTPGAVSGAVNHGTQTTPRASASPAVVAQSGVRILPIRTMVAAVPAGFSRLPSDSSANSLGLLYPVRATVQHVASGHVSASQSFGIQSSANPQMEQRSASDPMVQQQSAEAPNQNGDGSVPLNNQDAERQLPSSVLQFLRSIFPDGEILVENSSSHGTATASATEHGGPTTIDPPAAAEPAVTDQGAFLSNLLRQVMPYISQQGSQLQTDQPPESSTSNQGENSSNEATRRRSDSDLGSPNSKRRKME